MENFDFKEDEITENNVFNVPIQDLAVQKSASGLDFSEAGNQLTQVQSWLAEVKGFEFKRVLNQEDIQLVLNYTNELITKLVWLQVLDFSEITNPKAEFDKYVNGVLEFYNRSYTGIFKSILPILREDLRKSNPDTEKLEKELKRVVQLRQELEEEVKIAKTEAEKLRTGRKAEGAAKGDRASMTLAHHFDAEVNIYNSLSKKWLKAATFGYLCVLSILVWLGYETFQIISELTAEDPLVNNNIIWLSFISKLVILAALWYALSFVIKNYNVNANLAAVNRHRAAVARTLADFIVVEQAQQKPRLAEMLQNATQAMFKNAPIGFVSKTEKDNGNPIIQVVNDLMGVTKQ